MNLCTLGPSREWNQQYLCFCVCRRHLACTILLLHVRISFLRLDNVHVCARHRCVHPSSGLVGCLHLSAKGGSSAAYFHCACLRPSFQPPLCPYTCRFREHFITRNRIKGAEKKSPSFQFLSSGLWIEFRASVTPRQEKP